MKINLDKKSWQYLTLIFLAFVWGSSFILMKRGLESYSNFQVAAYRVFISFVVLSPVIVRNLSLVKTKLIVPLTTVGLLGNGIPAFLFTTAQLVLSSSFSGILNSTTPLFTVIIGMIFFMLRPKWINIAGVIIGLLGTVYLVMSNQELNVSQNELPYSLLIIGATVCYAISVNVIKTYLSELNSVQITAMAFTFIGPLCGIYLYSSGFFNQAFSNPQNMAALGYISVLGIFGTALCVIIFNQLIKSSSAVFASSVTYLIPVFAMFWGVFDGEVLSIKHFIGIAIILAGVYLVNFKKQS